MFTSDKKFGIIGKTIDERRKNGNKHEYNE